MPNLSSKMAANETSPRQRYSVDARGRGNVVRDSNISATLEGKGGGKKSESVHAAERRGEAGRERGGGKEADSCSDSRVMAGSKL